MKKTSEFDADGFLSGMFNEPPAGNSTTPADPAPEPLTTTRGEGAPDDSSSQTLTKPMDLGDMLPADASWNELPSPEPCRVCGGINCWWGLWDERRCSACEPAGQRSTELADRAARLR